MANLILGQPLAVGDQTITIPGACLEVGARVWIEDEACDVDVVLTPTQARIRRGMDGTLAVSHAKGVDVMVLLPTLAAVQHQDITPQMIEGTTQRSVCPCCGHLL